MTNQTEQRDDLQEKIDLELLFLPLVLGAFADERILFNISVRTSRLPPTTGELLEIWRPIIREQMRLSSDVFKLTSDDVVTQAEIDSAILNVIDDLAEQQSRVISETSIQNMNRSIDLANRAFIEQGEFEADNGAIATVGLRFLAPTQMGRDKTISATTTQTSAETGKFVAAGVLGLARKTWVTAGDEKVRSTHVSANGQTVAGFAAFIVGGASLLHPGDTSLGAPLGEIINCRCSAVYGV